MHVFNVFRLSDFDVSEIQSILDLAQAFADGKVVDYQGQKVVSNLFFEPSTRTHYSFDMAALRLGCKTQNVDVANSSVQKGESLYDTVKLFEAIGSDVIVIRHSQNDYFEDLKGIQVPILNGGDGTGNHPTQSLLDLLTIRQEFGHFEGLKCMIVGDIRHSRVAHTNYEVMTRLGMEVYFSGPEEFAEGQGHDVPFEEMLDQVDIVMLLRVQHERHASLMKLSKEEYHQRYGLTVEKMKKMKDTAIIMHPAPFNRGVEIADDVVESEKSRIFKQMENGVYVRMALIHKALSHG